jgi:hypothetical protein
LCSCDPWPITKRRSHACPRTMRALRREESGLLSYPSSRPARPMRTTRSTRMTLTECSVGSNSDMYRCLFPYSINEARAHLRFRIAIAGTIGTGLFLGSGHALAGAGPLGALIAYALVGTVAYSSVLSPILSVRTHVDDISDRSALLGR